ncbi:MAG: fucose-binding protein [Alphaproteobacteria bacterium]|nr:fucose-binding protein [Alphaproteobacteria bacterium]
MLKNIDPILTPDLLWCLAAMGHGDDLALVDANHPATRISTVTASRRLVSLPGVSMARAARAILSILPVDDFTNDPIRRMLVVDDAAAIPDVQRDVQAEIDRSAGRRLEMVGIERFAFYEAAQRAFAIVQVGDPRGYGCFLIRKGVVFGASPDA